MRANISPRLSALDSEFRGRNGMGHYSGNVIYLSTFSKLLAPGLRLAWVIAPPEVIRKLVMIKQAADLHTASFNQYVAYEVGKGGFLNEHVKVIRAIYKERRDVMLEMMEELFPSEVTWRKPKGGMFLWSILPEGMDAAEVLKRAVERKVAFVPGGGFHPRGGNDNTMRINFSYSSPETIREGITRLGNNIEGIDQREGVNRVGAARSPTCTNLRICIRNVIIPLRAMPCFMAVSATARATSRCTFLSSGLGISSPAGVMLTSTSTAANNISLVMRGALRIDCAAEDAGEPQHIVHSLVHPRQRRRRAKGHFGIDLRFDWKAQG